MTKDEANNLFEYNDGKLIWKARPFASFASEWAASVWHKRFHGVEAGTLYKRGYLVVSVSGKRYYTHRIIFLMFHGYLPKIVDHINGDRLDNRIENLREITVAGNCQNSKMPVTNTSGYKGVSWCNRTNKWSARISVNNKTVHLGRFVDIEEAARCYEEGAKKYYGEYRRKDSK